MDLYGFQNLQPLNEFKIQKIEPASFNENQLKIFHLALDMKYDDKRCVKKLHYQSLFGNVLIFIDFCH